MNSEEQSVFDIQTIYILTHKNEEANFSYACENRAWDGFVTVTSGECIFSKEGTSDKRLAKGDTVFLHKGERYEISAKSPCSYYTSAFDFSEDSTTALIYLPKIISLDAIQIKILEKMTEVWQRKTSDYYMFCKIQLLELYFDILKSAKKKFSKYNYDTVSFAVKFIHDNFTRNFKTEEIAAYASCSESHLRLKFAEKMGMTINEYRDTLRIRMAKELLSSGLFSVKETAYELGFCDVYYFTNFFTRHVGVTPGKFRSQQMQSSPKITQ